MLYFLTCDAFGVLPPVCRLTPEQAGYYFLMGYTAKVAGTECGVKEPEATFSPGFGAAFLVLHPIRYAKMLMEKLQKHNVNTWLVNTGWSGGSYGKGQRMKLGWTRAIVNAIHNGELTDQKTEWTEFPIFRLQVPKSITSVPDTVLDPRSTWRDPCEFDVALKNLAIKFNESYSRFFGDCKEIPQHVMNAGPIVNARNEDTLAGAS